MMKWKHYSLWFHGLYSPWNAPGQNTGVGSCYLLQGIFPTQGSNPCLLHWQEDSLPLCHLRSPEYALLLLQLSHVSRVRLCDLMDSSLPGSSVHGILQARILEWVAISSSRGSSQPRDQTHISVSPALKQGFFTTEPSGKGVCIIYICIYLRW